MPSKKHRLFDPTELPMPSMIGLPRGRLWILKRNGVSGYSSDGGDFDLLIGNGYVVLVAFEHAPNEEGQEFWRKRFLTVEEAMDYAERM